VPLSRASDHPNVAANRRAVHPVPLGRVPYNLGYREIAAELGISHGGVQLIERRALAKVAIALGLSIAEVAPYLRAFMRGELGRQRVRQ
jgi:hypothetical protein